MKKEKYNTNLTQKQIEFVHNYLETKKMATAYRYSYNTENMSDGSIYNAASRLMKNEKVKEYLEECRAELKRNVVWSREDGTQELLDVLYLAKSEGKYREVIRCVETLDKKYGYDSQDPTTIQKETFTITTVKDGAHLEALRRIEKWEAETGIDAFEADDYEEY